MHVYDLDATAETVNAAKDGFSSIQQDTNDASPNTY